MLFLNLSIPRQLFIEGGVGRRPKLAENYLENHITGF